MKILSALFLFSPKDKVNSEGHAKAQLSDLTGKKNSVGWVVSILYPIRAVTALHYTESAVLKSGVQAAEDNLEKQSGPNRQAARVCVCIQRRKMAVTRELSTTPCFATEINKLSAIR